MTIDIDIAIESLEPRIAPSVPAPCSGSDAGFLE